MFRRRAVSVKVDTHAGQEWDDYTQSWVRWGWLAERKAMMDAEEARIRSGGESGTCLDCGRPISAHPLPERLWRRGSDLCAQVEGGDDGVSKESES